MRNIIFIVGMLVVLIIFPFKNSFADEIDNLIPAIIQVESGGRADAMNCNGKIETASIGLMQITYPVLQEFNECDLAWAKTKTQKERNGYKLEWYGRYKMPDLFNPTLNRIIGEFYLRRLKDHYGCKTIEEILCAYNWGIGNLKKYGLKAAPQEVKSYIQKVLKARVK